MTTMMWECVYGTNVSMPAKINIAVDRYNSHKNHKGLPYWMHIKTGCNYLRIPDDIAIIMPTIYVLYGTLMGVMCKCYWGRGHISFTPKCDT